MPKPPKVRKISETILDFGEPLLSQLHGEYSEAVARSVFEIVVMVWNAHVLALPRWGQPQFLADLRQRVLDPQMPEPMVEAVRVLTQRRHARFASDARAVGEWDLVQRGGEIRLHCDARAPHAGGSA